MRSARTLKIALATALVGVLAGATVTYYDEALPTTMNPLFARSMVDFRSHELVFDRLFYRDAVTNKITSKVVARFERLDEGEAFRVWLKDGVKWHDGKPATGEDVCFTVDLLLDPAVPSRIAKGYREAIKSCSYDSSDGSATIRFNKAYHSPREQLAFSLLPKHVLEGSKPSPDLEFLSRPVGTGAMKGTMGRQAVKYTAVPNAHHDAKIRVLLQSEGGDPYVQVRTVLNKGVTGIVSVAPPLRPEIAASDEIGLKSYDLRSWWYIAVNTHRAPLDDVRVRQALNAALDRQELRTLTIGVTPDQAKEEGSPCEFVSGPFVPSSAYYNRSVPVQETADLAKVEQLMTAAGAKRVGGTWTKNGQPITLKVGMNATIDREAPDILSQIGNQLQAAGFDRQVYKITPDAWSRKALTSLYTDEYDLLVGKWSFGLNEEVNPLFETRLRGKGSLNIFRYSNPKVDELIAAYEDARTDTQARDAYHELHEVLNADLPYLFLWKLDTKSAWRNEVRNNMITPYYCFTEFDQWHYQD